jgi:hypothetical protein
MQGGRDELQMVGDDAAAQGVAIVHPPDQPRRKCELAAEGTVHHEHLAPVEALTASYETCSSAEYFMVQRISHPANCIDATMPLLCAQSQRMGVVRHVSGRVQP